MKMAYFQRKWRTRPEWIDAARMRFNEMFDEYRKDMYCPTEDASTALPVVRQSPRKVTTLMSWKFEGNISLQEGMDEVSDYLNLGTESEKAVPRHWWIANHERFPTLASMAWDIFSIPAMSAEVERVFSG